MENIKFISKGITCSAWYIPATTDKYMNSRGRPCVVMANGFGGTKDTGLLNFAEPLSKAGFDTFIFDYRGFGESGGFPRQNVSYKISVKITMQQSQQYEVCQILIETV